MIIIILMICFKDFPFVECNDTRLAGTNSNLLNPIGSELYT